MYARVTWTAEDVRTLREDHTEEQAACQTYTNAGACL